MSNVDNRRINIFGNPHNAQFPDSMHLPNTADWRLIVRIPQLVNSVFIKVIPCPLSVVQPFQTALNPAPLRGG